MQSKLRIVGYLAFGLVLFPPGRSGAADDERNQELAAPLRWVAGGPGGVPGFTRHVQPLLAKSGCSNRACHGSFQGQNGFRLSLFGSDPKLDYDELVNDEKGSRIDRESPEASLILQKATLSEDHKGGKRFDEDSWQYRLLLEWIRAGASYQPEREAVIERLIVTPSAKVLAAAGAQQPLNVIAHYSDGTSEDVTALTQFSSNDDAVARVSGDGKITASKSGDTAIVATFGGAVSTTHVIVPFAGGGRSFEFASLNRVDDLVAAKWIKLGLEPSPSCTDSEFLRRVSLDLIGTLPSPDEVRGFLADQDPNKRTKKIDELLERPEYALFWATKFSDLTGNDDRFLPQPRPKYVWLWYDWLRDKLARNVPYDELVAGIVTATSREGRTLDEFLAEYSKVAESMPHDFGKGFDTTAYAERKTNDIFWKKASNKGDQVAMQISYAFLGIHLECAQCHKHPFDRWTQDDFKSWVAFFSPVKLGVPSDMPKDKVPATGERNKSYQYQEVFVDVAANGGKAKGKGKNVADSGKGFRPKALGGGEMPIEPGVDPRIGVMKWMRAPENPYFAKAIVNRVWAHYLGAGIVDPPDDLNAANPPSNPALLDWLARDFIAHDFDLKHLHRVIAGSRVYQLSWVPNENNELDRRNFTHALLRRIPAEVIVDAINQTTGAAEKYGNNFAPPGTRAIGLAPSRVANNQGPGYALSIFGRPLRTQTCDCERSQDAGLPQALYLVNDVDINNKITAKNGRLAMLLREMSDDKQLLDELYLTVASRYPTEAEVNKALDYVAASADRKSGFEDVLWSLINLREFVFNH
jgi:hypothetical protein